MDKKITSKKTLKTYEFTVCGDSGYISLKTPTGYKQISKDGFYGDMLYAKDYVDFVKKCRVYVKNDTDSILGCTKSFWHVIRTEKTIHELPEKFTQNAGTYSNYFTTFSKNYMQMMSEFRKTRKENDGFVYGIYIWSASYGTLDSWELCHIID